MSVGRLFQISAPATGNNREPNVTQLRSFHTRYSNVIPMTILLVILLICLFDVIDVF